ncbi:hypothetical protein SAMN04488102_10340 [Alkalibacterium subtropicum]|uniref:AbrB family transcriptional regulator n=1 Tax=Alkalibacterium subtropicum TaxID=753702 RepID=A0A1I1GJH0_9LACT|nr:hypothetical protein [Alkalibacterium subtropicum]SFC10018.1 hypothetical protein SAMN04488102_10340 [Alkalibacterium subtropicum]
MATAKLCKQGDSIVLIIPATEADNVSLDKEYFVRIDGNGNISLITKLDNPFKTAKPGEFYEKDVWTGQV